MKGCGTFKVNEVMGAIDGLRKAARTAKRVYFAQQQDPPITPAMRDLADALERLDKLVGRLP